MNVKVHDLMVRSVITTTAHRSVGHAKDLMKKHGIHMLPVTNSDGEPTGVVSSTDLLDQKSDERPLGQIMTRKIYTIPEYDGAHIAARVMRNHRIHHLVVTHEGRVTGVLSSFDLLALVEDHRFQIRNAPTEARRTRGRS